MGSQVNLFRKIPGLGGLIGLQARCKTWKVCIRVQEGETGLYVDKPVRYFAKNHIRKIPCQTQKSYVQLKVLGIKKALSRLYTAGWIRYPILPIPIHQRYLGEALRAILLYSCF